MIRIILKTLWFNRSKNSILFLEIVLISIVFIIAFNFLFNQFKILKQPLGYDYKNVVTVSMIRNNGDSSAVAEHKFLRELKELDGVEIVCRADRQSQPFSGSRSSSDARTKDTVANFDQYGVDEHFADLMKMQIVHGRWIQPNDSNSLFKASVITLRAANELFGKSNVINCKYKYRGDTCIVVGVVSYFKRHGFDELSSGTFLADYISGRNERNSTIFTYLVRYRNEPDINTIGEIYNLFQQSEVSKHNRLFEVKTLSNAKSEIELEYKIVFYGIVIVIMFLLLNVLAGMAGLMWQTIKQRNYEFALRMAVGATSEGIKKQVVAEMLILVFLALIPTFIILSQIEVWDLEWTSDLIDWRSVLISTIILFVLTILFALMPANKASKTQPAIALKGE
jgi:putative ABC transport system permease protein